MNRFLYNGLLHLAAPAGKIYLHLSPRYRPLLDRFDPPAPAIGPKPLWIHACSVGELAVARPLVAALQAAAPQVPLMLTVSTVTAMEMARGLSVPVTWFPFDHPATVARFLDRIDPRAVLLIETELWPNVIAGAAHRTIPVAVVNGRLSDKHLPRFRRMGRLGRDMFAGLSFVGVQEERYGDRFVQLGADPGAIHVTGNIKFDAVSSEIDPAPMAQLRSELRWEETAPLLVFGSTRPGDEELGLQLWSSLRHNHSGLRLALVPRHIDRADEIAALIREPFLRRSRQTQEPGGAAIALVDTLGELTAFYAMADVAIVGGSFFPGVEGHNPIEPAALGVPTIFGPYMRNFRDAAEVLTAQGAAKQVPAGGLAHVLDTLLGDEDRRAQMGRQGRESVRAMQGATQRTVELTRPLWSRTV